MTKSMTAARKGINNNPNPGKLKILENVCYEYIGTGSIDILINPLII